MTFVVYGFAQVQKADSRLRVTLCRAFNPNDPMTWNGASPAEPEELPTLSQDQLNTLLGAYRPVSIFGKGQWQRIATIASRYSNKLSSK